MSLLMNSSFNTVICGYPCTIIKENVPHVNCVIIPAQSGQVPDVICKHSCSKFGIWNLDFCIIVTVSYIVAQS